MTPKHPRVLVVGSANMDVVLEAARFPEPGENVSCSRLQILPGGKAANQAVAAARLGARVRLIACLGRDPLSEQAYENLRNEGVDVGGIRRTSASYCGIAVVAVERSGENRIFSHPGANGSVTREDILAERAAFADADVVLLQLGIPKAAVEAAIELAKELKVPVILDPTPLAGWLPDNWADAALLIPNETELAWICGHLKIQASAAYAGLAKLGLRGLVLKRGAEGCIFQDAKTGPLAVPALKGLAVVDTTGAGDAFAGALGTEWVRTGDLARALRFAVVAAGLATTRVGAQSALATRAEVESRGASP